MTISAKQNERSPYEERKKQKQAKKTGVWYLEESHVLTLGGVEENTALRVQPLDQTCRELTRKCLYGGK